MAPTRKKKQIEESVRKMENLKRLHLSQVRLEIDFSQLILKKLPEIPSQVIVSEKEEEKFSLL